MADPALGTNSVVAIDFEQTWGTEKGSKKGRKLSVLKNSMTGTRDQIENPSMGGDYNPLDAISGLQQAGGQLVLIPTVVNFAFLAEWFCGNRTTTGVADPYTHVSKLSTDTQKSCVLETDINVGGTHKFIKANGVRINKWTIPIQPAGFCQSTIDLLAKSVAVGDTAYDAALDDWALDSPLEYMQLAAADLQVDGVAVGYIAGGSIELSANLHGDDRRVAQDGARGSLVPKRHTIGGTLDIVLDDAAIITLLAGGAVHALQLKFTVGTNRTVLLELPRIKMPITQPTLENDGPIQLSVPFKAAKDSVTGTSIRFTTVNDKAAADYA